jgi:hypothetical protein
MNSSLLRPAKELATLAFVCLSLAAIMACGDCTFSRGYENGNAIACLILIVSSAISGFWLFLVTDKQKAQFDETEMPFDLISETIEIIAPYAAMIIGTIISVVLCLLWPKVGSPACAVILLLTLVVMILRSRLVMSLINSVLQAFENWANELEKLPPEKLADFFNQTTLHSY